MATELKKNHVFNRFQLTITENICKDLQTYRKTSLGFPSGASTKY